MKTLHRPLANAWNVKLVLLFFIAVGVLFFCNFAYADTSHLWISQIQTTGGPGLTTNDFIEIYNPTDAPIDLAGMRLVKRSQNGATDSLIKSWADSVLVGAHGYYLWANSGFAQISVLPDITTSGSIADDNGIALRLGPNDTGLIIDSVAWGTAANGFMETINFPTNPSAGEVLLRSQDTDDNSIDFSLVTPAPHNSTTQEQTNPPPPPPTPEPPPPPPPAEEPPVVTDPTPVPPPPPPVAPSSGGGGVVYYSGIVISEFMPNPDGADSGEEWIELYNNSATDIDISGWLLDDEGSAGEVGSSAYTIPTGNIVTSGNYLVINLPEDKFALNNSGHDSVRLFWPNKQVTSQVDYTGPAKNEVSFARKHEGGYEWTSLVTKGLVNQFDPPQTDGEIEPGSDETIADAEISEVEPEQILPEIVISEIFPDPDRNNTEEEFIELKNKSETEIKLDGLVLSDLSTNFKLDGLVIPANGFLDIKKSESKIALNNFGKEKVSIATADGQMINSVDYEDAPQDNSYALLSDGTFRWSTTLTPGKTNVISVALSASKKSTAIATAVTTKKTASTKDQAPEEPKIFTPAVERIAGADVVTATRQNPIKSLWPWLIGSAALNLLFCYFLVKLMISKEKI